MDKTAPIRETTDIAYPATAPFAFVHLSALAVIWTGITPTAIILCLVVYWVRIFAIGAGYHRYFSHRAFATSRTFQFLLAALAQSSAQNSVLWWAANHRRHHLYSDTAQDIHSPARMGFIYSHVGWIFDRRHRCDLVAVEDFARYPELMWLHRLKPLPAMLLALGCYLIAGWSGLVVGFLWSTVLVYHATFCINSLAHVRGAQRFVTGDHSRNNWFLAIFTLGEGWHNNHHACQSSARQGFRWWEIDITFYILWLLSKAGIVWDLKPPPRALLKGDQRPSGRAVSRTAELLSLRFNTQAIARAVSSALQDQELADLRAALASGQRNGRSALERLSLRHIPKRCDVAAIAEVMFAKGQGA